jgi:hypothetical protein
VTAALPDHPRICGLHAVHDATQVDVDDAVPVRERELLQLAADGDAGVVEEQIDAAVLARDVVREGRPARRARRGGGSAPRGGEARRCG